MGIQNTPGLESSGHVHNANNSGDFNSENATLAPSSSRSSAKGETQQAQQAQQASQSQPPADVTAPLGNLDPAKIHHGWRRVVRNFTPSWFAVIMGTGIVSILLHNLPYNGTWLYWISVVVFALNVALFLLFLAISIIRYALYPEIWAAMIRHPVQSLFLGTFPMGLATIVNMVTLVCVPAWGGRTVLFAWALWWIDVVLSIFTCFYLPFVIMSVHRPTLSTMTATWLLPIAATVVASAAGSVVADALQAEHQNYALWTVIVSYVLWGTGVPFALLVLVIYFQRLTIHNLPPREVIVSVFLPLGPVGQGGFAIMQLGKVAAQVFPKTSSVPGPFSATGASSTLASGPVMSGYILYVLGWLSALIMWGFGFVWLFFALASIVKSRSFPFNMGWWGFVFPLGVIASSTTLLGKETSSKFFNILGTIFSLAVVLLWILVSTETIYKLSGGGLLYAPCLAGLEPRKQGLSEKKIVKTEGDTSVSEETKAVV